MQKDLRWVNIENGNKTPLRGVRRRFGFEQKELGVSFEIAIRRYKEAWDSNSLTPELVNQTWQLFWRDRERKRRLDTQLEIPPCDRTKEELSALRQANLGVILLPDELIRPEGRSLLIQLFPEGGEVFTTIYNNKFEGGGCIDVEMETTPPYRQTISHGRLLERRLLEIGRKPQRLPTYLAASAFNELVFGAPFDGNNDRHLLSNKSAISGSHKASEANGILCASFYKTSQGNWRLFLGPGFKRSYGYRTEARKNSA